MPNPSAEAILAGLTAAQRDILVAGPANFDEAEALPEGLFAVDEIWDVDSGEEWLVWEPTELGEAVRALAAKGA
jgi:hypothetical protein